MFVEISEQIFLDLRLDDRKISNLRQPVEVEIYFRFGEEEELQSPDQGQLVHGGGQDQPGPPSYLHVPGAR